MTYTATPLNWISVETRLPPMDQVVLVTHKSGYDGKPVLNFGARLDGGEGWIWGVGATYGIRMDDDASNCIEADDDYQVTHWTDINAPAANGEIVKTEADNGG